MRLAINAYFWNHINTGSGQYARQLVYHLNRLASDLEITLVFPQMPGDGEPTADGRPAVPPSVHIHPIPIRPGNVGKVWFEQSQFPEACREVGADLAHVPYWGGPLRSPVPLVVTVHDLTTLMAPEYRRPFSARLYNALVSASAKGADHIITDSFASKLDIMDRLRIPEEKITAIYLAAGPEYAPGGQSLADMAVRQKYDLPDFYTLYLGGYEIHKNVTTLLLAYTYVAQALGDEYPLVLAGKKPEGVTAVHPDYDQYIRQLHLEEQVRWIGFVDEADKPALYRNAETFIFPSRREGFGLPVLEALACGAPVVTTNASSLPEVVGDAGFAVDPDDDRGMAGAIIATLIQDEMRAELQAKAVQQAAQFSWQKTATETLLVYDQVMGGG